MSNKTLVLKRYPEYFNCTPGELHFEDKLLCYTIERPWLANKNKVSCIPLDSYALTITLSNRFKKLLPLVVNVPNRDGIRIHAANQVHELQGCIATVTQLSLLAGSVFGSNSVAALERLLTLIKTEKVSTLDVVKF